MLATHLAQVVYIYSFFGRINLSPTQSPHPEVPLCLPQAWSASALACLSPQPQWLGLYEMGTHWGPLGSQPDVPTGWALGASAHSAPTAWIDHC